MAADFSIKANDTLPPIKAVLEATVNGAKAPVDLTRATRIDFIMRSGTSGPTKVNAQAVIVDAPAGVVRYDWSPADTTTPGPSYLGEWEVHWEGGGVQTFPTKSYHSIEILADLDSQP